MSAPFIGEIRMGGWNFAPRGWAFCNGQLVPISEYDALFALIGTTYGGDGQSTFALPDLRGRTPVNQGTGTGLASFVMGQVGGTETVTLTVNQLPGHTHAAPAVPGAGTARDPRGQSSAGSTQNRFSTSAPNTTMHPTAISPVGGNQPHPNMGPYLAITYVIALEGIFPSPA